LSNTKIKDALATLSKRCDLLQEYVFNLVLHSELKHRCEVHKEEGACIGIEEVNKKLVDLVDKLHKIKEEVIETISQVS